MDDASDALALLADEQRLRVVGALLLGAVTTDEVTTATGLPKRRVLEALSRLEAGGLVTRGDQSWEFDVARLKEIARDARPREAPDDVGDVDADSARVLRTFLRGGRLTQIPLARQKRLVILDHVCRVFEIGVRYPEREVNAFLRAFHPDTAALRRYLVDEGFLSRDHNVYWRTGGSVEL
ncbi:MAG: DUF2087 domain-containing protein [Frankiales bacterium]|nr:DUF2087 domain-containing protein [Frankiales bacterium]